MFKFKTYCYKNGRLSWACDSVESWNTPEEAIEAARNMAKALRPMFRTSEYEEHEKGARVWYVDSCGKRIFKNYTI